MKMNLKKGFTLIELLVVVAIIGILASVVLASLTSARAKGKDAAVFAQLSNMRAQAELFYATNSHYGMNNGVAGAGLGAAAGVTILPTASCATTAAAAGAAGVIFGTAASSSGLDGLVKGACQSGATSITGYLDSAATTTVGAVKWAVAAQGSSANAYYCVDSSGTSKSSTTAITVTSAVCQ